MNECRGYEYVAVVTLTQENRRSYVAWRDVMSRVAFDGDGESTY